MSDDDFDTYEAQRIRLHLLQELASQESGSWTLSMLRRAIMVRGYPKTPEYLLNQLRWLQTEALAVRLLPTPGDEVVAKLRVAGRQHVEKVKLLAGVHAPADED